MLIKEQLTRRISENGPIPFEEFMNVSLYDPEEGFYGSGELKSVRSGDFLTSPEVSVLFGETLAAYVMAERDRLGEPFTVVEAAAGSGALLRSLLASVDCDALAVEVSPAARDSLRGFLPDEAVALELPTTIRGVVLANELIDNLPMALAQMTESGWRERWVGMDDGGALVFVDVEPRPEVVDWLTRFGGVVPDGGWVEVQLEAGAWVEDVLDRLVEGSIVLFDYGDTAEGLQPRRQDGTLRTYRSHHLGPHPLDEPGKTDITADVNFSALLEVASAAGADVKLLRQDDFLSRFGLRQRLSELRQTELSAARAGEDMERLRLRTLRTEAEVLLHPRGLGDFRVLIAAK